MRKEEEDEDEEEERREKVCEREWIVRECEREGECRLSEANWRM